MDRGTSDELIRSQKTSSGDRCLHQSRRISNRNITTAGAIVKETIIWLPTVDVFRTVQVDPQYPAGCQRKDKDIVGDLRGDKVRRYGELKLDSLDIEDGE